MFGYDGEEGVVNAVSPSFFVTEGWFCCYYVESYVTLFIVIVLLGLDYQHRYTIIIYVIDNSVMSCDMAGIGNIVATDQSFRMPQSCTRMLHDIHQDLCCLLEEIRIGLLPLTQSLVSLLGILKINNDN